MDFQEMYKPRKRVVVDASEGVGAKQAPRAECDINNIMRRYVKSGQLPAGVSTGTYGDFSQASDLMDAYATIERAKAQFMSLPSGVRERFRNDPAAFLAFVQDKENAKEARELGLLLEESDEKKRVEELKAIADRAAAAVLEAQAKGAASK